MLNQNQMTILISIIWGFGLAILLRKTCEQNKCVIYKVPKTLEQNNNIIKSQNKCFKLEKYYSKCIY